MVVRRDGYVRAALELLDEVGLDGLSLRKLGTDGTRPPEEVVPRIAAARAASEALFVNARIDTFLRAHPARRASRNWPNSVSRG